MPDDVMMIIGAVVLFALGYVIGWCENDVHRKDIK